tara:strand:+ start:2189 stop:2602 length:414 start_codon:yes stop_codon:yes gene_type:complete
MAISHRPLPPNYGNNWDKLWSGKDFALGDAVECGYGDPDYGIISFLCEDSMSVCTGCGTGTHELPHRDINVVISNVVPVRKLEDHEYSKLDAQLRKGCKTKVETSEVEASEEGEEHVSHTLRKRIGLLDYTPEGKTY